MDGVDYVADTYPFTSAKIWIEENDLLNVCLKQALMPAVSVSTGAGTVTTTGWPSTGSVRP